MVEPQSLGTEFPLQISIITFCFSCNWFCFVLFSVSTIALALRPDEIA